MKKSDLIKDKPKTITLEIRVSQNQLSFIKTRALHYGYSNVSEWVRYCLFNYNPKKKK